jgi:hypothetical protein
MFHMSTHSCIWLFVFQASHQQLVVCSNARAVEVAVQRPGDATPSYLQTLRCQAHGECWKGTASLQASHLCTHVNPFNRTHHQLDWQQAEHSPEDSALFCSSNICLQTS